MESVRSVIIHNVAPMRSEPRQVAEQVSQAIMGDYAYVLEESGDYALIRTLDRYEGWILREHVRPCPTGISARNHFDPGIVESALQVCVPFANVFGCAGRPISAEHLTILVYGTFVKGAGRSAKGATLIHLANGERGFVRSAELENPTKGREFSGDALCAQARQFLGTPYLWGGTTPFGFDCSGFVQRIYAMFGVMLPRDAYLQAVSPLGARVEESDPLRPGDLVFFCDDLDKRDRGITHVGLALGEGEFIHSSGKQGVAVTPLDEPRYAREYRGAWRCGKA